MSNLIKDRIDIIHQLDAKYKPPKKSDEVYTYLR